MKGHDSSLLDDKEATRYILRHVLEPDFEVFGEATNGQEAVEACEKLSPDLVILDVSMPVMNGFEAARLLRSRMPDQYMSWLVTTPKLYM